MTQAPSMTHNMDVKSSESSVQLDKNKTCLPTGHTTIQQRRLSMQWMGNSCTENSVKPEEHTNNHCAARLI